jgi:outer membrane receptor protein involved in Fe transport
MMNRIWQDSGGRTFTLSASGYGGQWHSPGFIDTAQYNAGHLTAAANPTDGGNEIFGTVRGALSRAAWGGTLTSSLFAHAGWWNIFLTIPPEGGIGEGVPSQTQETDQRYGLGGETRWSEQIGATHLIVGLEYRAVRAEYQRYYTTDRARDSLFYFDAVPATLDAFYGAVSPVVEAHWDPTSQLSFGIGARLDWLYYSSEQIAGGGRRTDGRALVTPKLSALYRFTDAFAAYASFNGGFRSSDGVIVTPTLPPALEEATEVGLRYNGRTLEGSLGVFLINVRNQQTVDPVTLQPGAGGTTRQQGVELDGRAGLTRWLALFVNATVNDAHYVNLITDSGDNLAGVPVYQVANATADVGIDVDYKGISGSLWGAYMGPWTPVNEPDTRTSPYTLLNLRAAFPLSGPWSGALGVQNILDQRYVEVQASGYVSPGTPRQLLLSVRHGF